MLIREIAEAEIRKHLPPQYLGQIVRALPLTRADGEKRMFYFVTPETAELVEQLVSEQKRITGYRLCIYCSAIGPDVVHGKTVVLTQLVLALREQTGWDIRESKYSGVFEVHDIVEGEDKSPVQQRVAEVDRLAMALSLRNGLGFQVLEPSIHPIFVGQPFGLVIGRVERAPVVPEPESYQLVAELQEEQRRFAAATALREIYSQVTPRTKLIIGWAAVEDLFPSVPEHVLAPKDLAELVGLLEEHPALRGNADIRRRVETSLRDPQFFAKERRNERLARQISGLLEEDYARTFASIRSASVARGRLAHARAPDEDVRAQVAFLERVLLAVLDQPSLVG